MGQKAQGEPFATGINRPVNPKLTENAAGANGRSGAVEGVTALLGENILKSFRVVLLLTLVFAGWALAQSFLGSITGVVVDPTGSVVPNARVEATDVTRGISHTATTNNEGRYAFPALTPGTYVVNVGLEGFKSVKSSQLILTAQQTVRFDATLEIGTSAQSIEVTTAPPTMNLENAELGDLRTHEELVNMHSTRPRFLSSRHNRRAFRVAP